MKYLYKRFLLVSLGFIASLAIFSSGCKKIDLKRIAVISTINIDNITTNSARANGTIIDLGNNMTDHGFCWTTSGIPEIINSSVSAGSNGSTGNFNLTITGLQPNTTYNIRSYIKDDSGITYGDLQGFKTLQTGTGQWLHYDDGTNFDAIGFEGGGTFDVAIRFPKEVIQEYQGYNITKIRFIPFEETQTEYYVTIWEGDEPPELRFDELVQNPTFGNWTEHTLSISYPINTAKELWVGYWIYDHPSDTYPAGVDNGPATKDYGDLLSTDNGETWEALSDIDPPNMNYNWNLQFYIENSAGKTVLINSNVLNRKMRESKVEVDLSEILLHSLHIN